MVPLSSPRILLVISDNIKNVRKMKLHGLCRWPHLFTGCLYRVFFSVVSVSTLLVLLFQNTTFTLAASPGPPGTYMCRPELGGGCSFEFKKCNAGFDVPAGACSGLNCDIDEHNCEAIPAPAPAPAGAVGVLNPQGGCPSSDYVDTAIGCVPTAKLDDFLKFMLKWIFGAAGGIIVLMVIFTGYTLLTSSGNPEKLKEVQENVVSIISGLILIVFSVVLLRLVGVDILGLPGFV